MISDFANLPIRHVTLLPIAAVARIIYVLAYINDILFSVFKCHFTQRQISKE